MLPSGNRLSPALVGYVTFQVCMDPLRRPKGPESCSKHWIFDSLGLMSSGDHWLGVRRGLEGTYATILAHIMVT